MCAKVGSFNGPELLYIIIEEKYMRKNVSVGKRGENQILERYYKVKPAKIFIFLPEQKPI